MFILGWILWGSEVTHETMDPASGLGSHRTMTLSTPCTYMKRQKTLEGLVLFGCQLGFRVHISRPLTCPSCTQIGQVLLVFFLALRWLPSPLSRFWWIFQKLFEANLVSFVHFKKSSWCKSQCMSENFILVSRARSIVWTDVYRALKLLWSNDAMASLRPINPSQPDSV